MAKAIGTGTVEHNATDEEALLARKAGTLAELARVGNRVARAVLASPEYEFVVTMENMLSMLSAMIEIQSVED